MNRTPTSSPAWELSSKRDERIAFIQDRFNCTKREAVHIIWSCGYTVGDSTALWITHHDAARHLAMFRNAECECQLVGA